MYLNTAYLDSYRVHTLLFHIYFIPHSHPFSSSDNDYHMIIENLQTEWIVESTLPPTVHTHSNTYFSNYYSLKEWSTRTPHVTEALTKVSNLLPERLNHKRQRLAQTKRNYDDIIRQLEYILTPNYFDCDRSSTFNYYLTLTVHTT